MCIVRRRLAAILTVLVGGVLLFASAMHATAQEVTVLCMGPPTTLARAMDRDPEVPFLVKRLVCMGGTLNEPGNAGPVTEFHFACDPLAARRVVQCGANVTLIPLDVTRKALFSPTDLAERTAHADGLPSLGAPATHNGGDGQPPRRLAVPAAAP